MSSFDLKDRRNVALPYRTSTEVRGSSAKTKDEPIIAFKIYDSCRVQDCCTAKQLGPVRCACHSESQGIYCSVGDIVTPPIGAAAITVCDLIVKDVIIVSKCKNAFKKGYWDLDLKYIFEYKLTFREADGTIIGSVLANSIYNKKVTLFGSCGTNLMVVNDLFPSNCNNLNGEPYVYIESKAVALSAEIKHCHHHHHNNTRQIDDDFGTVEVTIGLFSIIKLYRLVDLVVESKGFYIPEECDDCPVCACDFFDNLDFPMDIFSPPQKQEFFDGVSGDIKRTRRPRNEQEYESFYCKKVKQDDDSCCNNYRF